MKVQSLFSLLCILVAANAFAPAPSSTKGSTTSLRLVNLDLAQMVIANSPGDIANTIIPLTITASAFWSTVKQASAPDDLPFFHSMKISTTVEETTSATPVAPVVEEVSAPVMEVAPVAVVEEKVQEDPALEVVAPVLAAVVEEPVAPVVVAVEEEPVAPTAVAVVEDTAVETTKTRVPILKSLSKLARIIYTPWVGFFKSLSKLLKFLYLPWVGMIPKPSKSS